MNVERRGVDKYVINVSYHKVPQHISQLNTGTPKGPRETIRHDRVQIVPRGGHLKATFSGHLICTRLCGLSKSSLVKTLADRSWFAHDNSRRFAAITVGNDGYTKD